MEKVIKFILISFIFIIGLGILILDKMPKDDNIELMLKEWELEINKNFPHDFELGRINGVSFKDKFVIYDITTYESSNIIEFYKEHYEDFKYMLLYSFSYLNGTDDNGDKIVYMLFKVDYDIKVVINTIDVKSISWDITKEELEEFLKQCKLTPTEALRKVLNMHIELAKLNIPVNVNSEIQTRNLTTEFMASTIEEGCLLIDIKTIDNLIVFEYLVDDTKLDFDFATLRALSQTDEGKMIFAEIFAEDASFREFLNLIVLSQSNLGIMYKGVTSIDSVEIVLPYAILRNYCTIPQDIL